MQNPITIKYIRDYILDNHITEYDTVVMNTFDFDDIVLEHRQTYGSPINIPFFLLTVLIMPDEGGKVNRHQFNIIRNDPRQMKYEDDDDLFAEQVYRCGWCGNIVDYDGTELSNETRSYQILVLQKYGDSMSEKINGYCCKHENC